jgi:O-antigen/teichoic acid export membrane protein
MDNVTLFHKLWHSPTLTTYGSFIARSLGLVVVLPFLLTELTTEEISLWYLFSAIAGFQLLIDLGFSPTFSRVIAYAMGGADVHTIESPRGDARGSPNWETLERICSTMGYVYSRLGVAWFLILVCIGTLAVYRPITMIEDGNFAWLAWAVVLGSSTISFFGIAYSSYLQGVNQIAVLRRWEIITSIGSAVTSVLVLTNGGDLLALVIASQGWQIINTIRNRWLSRTVLSGRMKTFHGVTRDEKVLCAVWPSTWRTGVGVLTSYGVVQASSIIYAQIASPAAAATYFLALRLIQAVSQFSQAPFYSKLPTLARLYSEGRNSDLVQLARKGMSLAYLTFVVGFVILGALGAPILEMIGSNAAFPGFLLWALLGVAYFVERYGAMHINLYGTTNDIINHVANGVAGIIYMVVGVIGFRYMGIYAFPVALIVGNAGFYAWYAASHSYRAFGLGFLLFERAAMLPYLGVLFLYIITVSFR